MSELFRRKIEQSMKRELINSFNFQIFKDSPNHLLKTSPAPVPPVLKKKVEPTPVPELKPAKTELNLKHITLSDGAWSERQTMTPPKILILGDIESESQENIEIDLDLPKWGLLQKICDAIKLQNHEISFVRFITSDVEHFSDCPNFQNYFEHFNPEFIFILGASPLKFFGIKERLSMVHGKVLEIEHKSQTINLVPLFHPEYLLINPNMKRKVWNDLQEIIKKLHQK